MGAKKFLHRLSVFLIGVGLYMMSQTEYVTGFAADCSWFLGAMMMIFSIIALFLGD